MTFTQSVLELLLSFILPPLAVFIHVDKCNAQVLISVCLLFLFWFPAVLHALWICFFRDDAYGDHHWSTPMPNAETCNIRRG
uniref:Plasma membrane proteolipid 3 n=1 Tax=Acrobeloides nanus TaxID=290746 RepID=A0A914DL76_9BILA